MDKNLTKDAISKSIDIISDIKLSEDDYNNIFEQFKGILNNNEIDEILKIISRIPRDNEIIDLKTILKNLAINIPLNDLNSLLNKIIKNEKFINYIQDLFLEKLM